LGPWVNSSEQRIFEHQVLGQFVNNNKDIHIDYQGTRALDAVLQEDIEKGTSPEVALLPSPGSLASYAAQNQLYPLDRLVADLRQRYGEQWVTLEEALRPKNANGELYAAVYKVNLKSVIWYNPTAMRDLFGPDWKPPTTWAGLGEVTKRISR